MEGVRTFGKAETSSPSETVTAAGQFSVMVGVAEQAVLGATTTVFWHWAVPKLLVAVKVTMVVVFWPKEAGAFVLNATVPTVPVKPVTLPLVQLSPIVTVPQLTLEAGAEQLVPVRVTLMVVGALQLMTGEVGVQAEQVTLMVRVHEAVVAPTVAVKVIVWLPLTVAFTVRFATVSTLPQLSVADRPNCAAVTVTVAGNAPLCTETGVVLPQLLPAENEGLVGVQVAGFTTTVRWKVITEPSVSGLLPFGVQLMVYCSV